MPETWQECKGEGHGEPCYKHALTGQASERHDVGGTTYQNWLQDVNRGGTHGGGGEEKVTATD